MNSTLLKTVMRSLLLVFLSVFSLTTHSFDLVQVQKILASDIAAMDEFGFAVSLDGDRALIGASYNDDKGTDSGSAYIFEKDASGDWQEITKLLASDGAEYDYFGSSVSLDGDTVLIGAYGDDIDDGIDNGDDFNVGSAYVFIETSPGFWTQQVKLIVTGGVADEEFGSSVSLSGDTALIGKPKDSSREDEAGSAYIFQREASGVWTEQAKLEASDALIEFDLFGNSVSLDGDTALIGAFKDDDGACFNTGSAYIFQIDGSGDWTQQDKLMAQDLDCFDEFGHSVALDGDTALIGAHFDDDAGAELGSAYIFQVDASGDWIQQDKLVASDDAAADEFGFSVALENNIAVIGARFDDATGIERGSIYVFQKEASGDWTEQDKLITNDAADYDRLGFSVALSGDVILAGVPGDNDAGQGTDTGSVYFYELDTDEDGYADSVETSNGSDPLDNSSTPPDNDGDFIVDADDPDDDNDGYSDTDENANGTDLLDSGSTPPDNDGDFVSDLNDPDDDNDGYTDVVETVNGSDPLDSNSTPLDHDGDGISNDVDLDDDGDGLPDSYENSYVFLDPLNSTDGEADEDGDGYNNVSEYHALTNPDDEVETPANSVFYKVIADDAGIGDRFGNSVSIDGNTALVGTPDDDDMGNNSGSAYIFEKDASGIWIQQAKLVASDGAANDYFGSSVSLDGDMALVGAPSIGSNDNSGSAYVFEKDASGIWTQQSKLLYTLDDTSFFGTSVSLKDGMALVTAAESGSVGGRAFIFKDSGLGFWYEDGMLDGAAGLDGVNDTIYLQFGISISFDGNTALIGGVIHNPNIESDHVVHVFTKIPLSDNWMTSANLVPNDDVVDSRFGKSVSVEGNTALVSATNSVYVFQNYGGGIWAQVDKFTASDGINDFGKNVSLDGNTALVGATEAAYIFQENASGNWVQVDKFTAIDGANNFGTSVSLDGDTALVAASNGSGSSYFISLSDNDGDDVIDAGDAFPNDPTETADTDNDGIGDNADTDDDNDGTPDISDALPLNESEDTDTDGDGVGDNTDVFPNDFVESFDTDGDGLGNNFDTDDDNDGISDEEDPDYDNDGMPNIYENKYAFLDPLNATDGVADEDGDGFDNVSEYHAVTDPENALDTPAGSAIYKVIANDGKRRNFFGYHVAIDGDTAIVGSPDIFGSVNQSAYIYIKDASDNWTQYTKLTPSNVSPTYNFGSSVAISGDTALVGVGANSYVGVVHIFTRDGSGNWSEQNKIIASDASEGDNFGSSVALSGNTVLVGASGDNDFGNSGSAYIFTRDASGNWSEQDKIIASDASTGGKFGSSIVMSADTMLVGASEAAYIFTRDGSGNWNEQNKIIASDASVGDNFGSSVALSGNTVLVGASGDDDNGGNSGSAYIFTRDGSGNWSEQDKIIASDASTGGKFGSSIVMSADTMLVGASEAAYIFTRDGSGNWSEQNKIIASDASVGDNFGSSVALSGNTVLVGASGDNDNGRNSGSAYFFSIGDSDGDGVLDINDDFINDPNETTDTDGDGIGNNADTDDDNDGTLDINDAFPLDASEDTDTDGDGIGDNADTSFDVATGDVATLIASINAANDETNNPGVDIIELESDGNYPLTVINNTLMGNTGLPAITSDIIIKGNGASITGSIANIPCNGAGDEFRFFLVAGVTGKLTLNNTTVTNGCAYNSEGGGIAVTSGASLNLNNSAVINSTAQTADGVYNNGGTVSISR
jgi:FG-GAP repeat protein